MQPFIVVVVDDPVDLLSHVRVILPLDVGQRVVHRPVEPFHFGVVGWRMRTDPLVLHPKARQRLAEVRRDIGRAVVALYYQTVAEPTPEPSPGRRPSRSKRSGRP